MVIKISKSRKKTGIALQVVTTRYGAVYGDYYTRDEASAANQAGGANCCSCNRYRITVNIRCAFVLVTFGLGVRIIFTRNSWTSEKKRLVRLDGDCVKISKKEQIVVGAPLSTDIQESFTQQVQAETDVIDLGSPRRVRASLGPQLRRLPRVSRLYTPNPRLYPGSSKKREKRRPVQPSAKRPRRRKFTRPVPNSRLYRPTPPPPRPPPPPPARPRASWPTPAPAPPRGALDTASRAALRLLGIRSLRRTTLTPLNDLPSQLSASSLLFLNTASKLPLRAARPLGSAMAASKYSTSPDCSDGNDASSAPSEFLAEFLSAIMRRQYAEALKYCQLILQYEPHNATAQGFYPLLRHKLHAHTKDETSSSEDTSSKRGKLFNVQFRQVQKSDAQAKIEKEEEDGEDGEEGGEVEMSQSSSGSASLCSSLELDSSSPPSPRLARAPPDDITDPSDPTDPSDSSWRWESGGDCTGDVGDRSERDDNGNPTPPTHLAFGSAAESSGKAVSADAENNTASALRLAQAKSETDSPLRRLRAHFACSIK